MNLIRNFLAIIGLLVIVVVVVGIVRYEPMVHNLKPLAQAYQGLDHEQKAKINTVIGEMNEAVQSGSYDPGALDTYLGMASTLFETGKSADATVWKVKVEDGLSAEEVEQTMKFVANEHNIKDVGELPLYKEIEAMSGQKSRFLKIYMFCNAMTALKMLDYSDAFSAYLPCRVAMVEDKEGQLWLYSLNMDMMIHGGETLPPDLKEAAEGVKEIILDIMNRGATGEF
jgi:uncharacterized protein (DUF302 family)